MMTYFEFATANRIAFGYGAAERNLGSIAALGERALLVLGASTSLTARLTESLAEQELELQVYEVHAEPSVQSVEIGVEQARSFRADLVISLGGGSAIDTGKAIAALVTNPRPVLDYLEVVGEGLPLTTTPLPVVAIPTTAGTGAEVTRNAVLAAPEQRVKVSLRHPLMLPKLAVIDPEFTLAMPAHLTASTGLDALTQLIEPYLSINANPLTDAFCEVGIPRAAQALPRAFHHADDRQAREAMCQASLMGGLALANAKLGAVHGFAGPIGGMFQAPHGAVCARLLPEVVEMNYAVIQARNDQSPVLARFRKLAPWLTGDVRADVEAGIAWLRDLVVELEVPPLSSYGISQTEFQAIVRQAEKSSSMQGNPVKLSAQQLEEILWRAL